MKASAAPCSVTALDIVVSRIAACLRSDQDDLKMSSNAHLTFSTSLLGVTRKPHSLQRPPGNLLQESCLGLIGQPEKRPRD
ncbi:Protein Efr3 B [Manis pentadactyla]|nr:Protein Efr3 B [Manis pentadactyla]